MKKEVLGHKNEVLKPTISISVFEWNLIITGTYRNVIYKTLEKQEKYVGHAKIN